MLGVSAESDPTGREYPGVTVHQQSSADWRWVYSTNTHGFNSLCI